MDNSAQAYEADYTETVREVQGESPAPLLSRLPPEVQSAIYRRAAEVGAKPIPADRIFQLVMTLEYYAWTTNATHRAQIDAALEGAEAATKAIADAAELAAATVRGQGDAYKAALAGAVAAAMDAIKQNGAELVTNVRGQGKQICLAMKDLASRAVQEGVDAVDWTPAFARLETKAARYVRWTSAGAAGLAIIVVTILAGLVGHELGRGRALSRAAEYFVSLECRVPQPSDDYIYCIGPDRRPWRMPIAKR